MNNKLLIASIFALCIVGVFSNTCHADAIYCATCTASGGTVCQTCKVPTNGDNVNVRGLGNTPPCSCDAGYTDDVDVNDEIVGCKIDCAHQCETCDVNTKADNICTACKNPDMMLPKCFYLKEGYYIPDDTLPLADQTYEQCAKKCKNCENTADNCVVVGSAPLCDGQNRDPVTCEPLTGYYDNAGKLQDAVKCPEGCNTCQSATLCDDCDSTKQLMADPFTGACKCNAGFRVFEEDVGCEKCYMLSDVCVQTCPQNTVQNEKLQICETLEYEMISNATLILVLGILVGIIQIALCCFVYVCLQRKHDIMEKELHEEQMKIKQQRDHIYKNMDNYNGSVDYSKSGTGSPFKSNKEKSRGIRSNMDESNSELSSSNLQSSQVNLFNRDQNKSQSNVQGSSGNVDLDDISSGQDGSQVEGGKRRRRRQVQ